VVWGFGYVGEIERGKMTILDDAKGGGGGGGVFGVGVMVCFKRVGRGWWLSIRP